MPERTGVIGPKRPDLTVVADAVAVAGGGIADLGATRPGVVGHHDPRRAGRRVQRELVIEAFGGSGKAVYVPVAGR